jgi:hypothetical protein
MGLNSEDMTVHPLLQHERRITAVEGQHQEHVKDGHAGLVNELVDRLNNFQSDVFTRIDQAHQEQNTYLHNLLDPIGKRLDDLESEIWPDGKGEKSDDSEDDSEDDDSEDGEKTPAPSGGVEMVTPDVQASPKPPEKQRQNRRAKRRARIAAKGQAK